MRANPEYTSYQKMHNLQTALAITLASGYRYLSPVPVPNVFNPCIMSVHLVSPYPQFILTLSLSPNNQAIHFPPMILRERRAGATTKSAPFLLQAEGVYPPAPRVRDVAFPEPHRFLHPKP
jgi:hypothetical protein